MSDQQQEGRERDPREDLIAIVADARGPVTVEIMFTRAELEFMRTVVRLASDAEISDGILAKLNKLLAGGAR